MTSRATFSVAAEGVVGIAIEDRPSVYKAPQIFVPITSESLSTQESNVYRRLLQDTPDPVNVKAGNEAHEGNIEMEALIEILPYFLFGMRGDVSKSAGAGSGDHVYTFNPTTKGQKGDKGTLSLTIVRADVVFAYTGCVIGSLAFNVNDGLLNMTLGIMGADEGVQPAPSNPSWPATVPFGSGEYQIEIPVGTQVYDADTFTFNVNDNATSEYRLQNTRRGPWFIKFGERSVDLDTERDFNSRAEFDNYKNLTQRRVKITAVRRDDNERYLTIDLGSSVVDSHEVSLSGGQGDLVRASVKYMGVLPIPGSQAHTDLGGNIYRLTIGSGLDLTVGAGRPYGWVEGTIADTTGGGSFKAPDFIGVPAASSYTVEVNSADTFASGSAIPAGQITEQGNPSANPKEDCSFTVTGLSASTTYYVRCKAGTNGDWSDTVEFTTTA